MTLDPKLKCLYSGLPCAALPGITRDTDISPFRICLYSAFFLVAKRRSRSLECSVLPCSSLNSKTTNRTRTFCHPFGSRIYALCLHVPCSIPWSLLDHGKTTLVDAMLQQSSVFRDNEQVRLVLISELCCVHVFHILTFATRQPSGAFLGGTRCGFSEARASAGVLIPENPCT